MIVKLAIRNIKKSIKDYSIYFLTLTLTIAIFYIFNSFSDLSIMSNFSTYKMQVVEITNILISVVSVFIAIVFAFVIIYANNFIIKKRNKEFATYILLGMPKGKVSKMLLTETILVGILSLIVGLIIGILFSQVFCFLVAKIFSISLEFVGFSFSLKSLIYTTALFAGMFIVVGIFGSLLIVKSKLITLMNSHRKNEKVAKSIGIKGIIFLLISLALLGIGYYLVNNNGLLMFGPLFWIMCLCGGIGTVGIYIFLSQIFMYLMPKLKKMYYRNANVFVVKQIGNKINTNGILLGVISLMIFLSICALTAGIGMNDNTNQELNNMMPYDAYVTARETNNIKLPDFSSYDKAIEKEGGEILKSITITTTELNIEDVSLSKEKINMENVVKGDSASIMKQSDFNKLMDIMNEEMRLNLGKNQYVLLNNDNLNSRGYKIEKIKNLTLAGNIYTPAQEDVINIQNFGSNTITGYCKYIIVVADDSYPQLNETDYLTKSVGHLIKLKKEITEEQSEAFEKVVEIDRKDDKNGIMITSVSTKQIMKVGTQGMGISLVFIGVYMSIIFIISSTALLAIQQLSDASDHKYRFDILEKIGADKKLINKAILKQILVYFLAPIIMAIISSIVGVLALQKIMTSIYVGSSLLMPYLVTIGLFAIIYIVYYIATFFGYKSTIKTKVREID